ncbi:MAG: porin [Acidobacteriia bacterium]|nr:porin [Terriglobia bacterium]
MKKILLCSAAVAMGFALSTPAKAAADGIKLGAGGQFNGYVVWGRQSTDTPGVNKDRTLDILRDTEVNLTGEDTLDNGLTVGIYNEFNIDGNQGIDGVAPTSGVALENVGTVQTKESYAYFSGAWGRVNFGKEDGAAYLLQVAAPSADSNLDGLRQLINPVNYALTNAANGNFKHDGVNLDKWYNAFGIDYSNDVTGDYNKLTYLTPVFSGFQFGVSYTPDVNNFGLDQNGLQGVHSSNGGGAAAFGSALEGSGRYEGKWQNIDVTLGGGYTHVGVEKNVALSGLDSFKQWNFGANIGWEAFNFGAAYLKDNGGQGGVPGVDDSNKTWVAGVDYTTGPYKLGFSYLNNSMNLDSSVATADTSRYTGGLVYTYGPGMTFRGSVSYVTTGLPNVGVATSDVTATDVLLGTQINF